ncbi:MAG: DNA polymerase III subunit beta [Nitrospirales bacterium]|nr:DNA polymerase III subunit beta [Nitrospirales bacterium]
MKVTVHKEELQRKLSDIQNIVEKKNTMPILNHFLLSAGAEGSYITATDLETAFKGPIELAVEEGGKMCIPAKKLFEIVREMEGDVTIESLDSQWVRVKAGRSQFKLACLSADEFPVWPALSSHEEEVEEMEIDASILLEMIDRSLYAAGESDSRYVLNGLLLHINTDGRMTVVGTDGHRLALTEKEMGLKPKEEKKLIISRKSVAELKRFLGDSQTTRLSIGMNHVLFSIDDVKFLTRLIEGTYPSYEQVIPVNNEKSVVVPRETLSRALRRVSLMSKEKSSAVKVEISPEVMVISASNPDLGEAKDEITTEYAGDPLVLAFNARYILDILSVMASDRVVLKLNEPLSPVLITEEGGDDYRCVVMPMRL